MPEIDPMTRPLWSVLGLRCGVGSCLVHHVLRNLFGGDAHFFVEVLVRLARFTQELEQPVDDEGNFTGTTSSERTR